MPFVPVDENEAPASESKGRFVPLDDIAPAVPSPSSPDLDKAGQDKFIKSLEAQAPLPDFSQPPPSLIPAAFKPVEQRAAEIARPQPPVVSAQDAAQQAQFLKSMEEQPPLPDFGERAPKVDVAGLAEKAVTVGASYERAVDKGVQPNSYQFGAWNSKMDLEYSNAGTDKRVLKELQAKDAEYGGFAPEQAEGFWGKAVQGFAGSAPAMLQSIALSPTVAGPSVFWQQQGAGSFMRSYIQGKDIDQIPQKDLERAQNISQLMGIPYAAIELAVQSIPGMKGFGSSIDQQLSNAIVNKALKMSEGQMKRLAGGGIAFGIRWLLETAEEGGQGAVGELASQILERSGIDVQKIMSTGWEELKGATGTTLLMTGTGLGGKVITDKVSQTVEARAAAIVAQQQAQQASPAEGGTVQDGVKFDANGVELQDQGGGNYILNEQNTPQVQDTPEGAVQTAESQIESPAPVQDSPEGTNQAAEPQTPVQEIQDTPEGNSEATAPENIYMRMPIERVQEDAQLGNAKAQEALAARQQEIDTPEGNSEAVEATAETSPAETQSEQPPSPAVEAPVKATESYSTLPEKTRSKFEAAFDGKDVKAMSEYLHQGNKRLRAEFESRTQVKLPKTVKGTDAAVNKWAGADLRTMDEDGRVSDGRGGINPGDTFKTSSGRKTTPYPQYNPKSETKSQRKASAQWLIDNAIAEAESRGDDYNVSMFKAERADNMPEASKQAATMYLFGEQPKVVPSILKPLSPPPEQATDRQKEKAAPKGEELSYDEFKKLYSEAFKNANKYTLDQAGSRVFTDKMADLADKYPEFAERVENEKPATVKEPLTVESFTENEGLRMIDDLEGRSSFDAPAAPVSKIGSIVSGEGTSAQKTAALKKTAAELGITAKEVQEAAELELVRSAQAVAVDASRPFADRFRQLVDAYNSQPSLNARTSTSVRDQAYSTPSPLAFALSHMVGNTANTVAYDPTGGNGMLLIGSNIEKSIANELNPTRASNLSALGVGMVTQNDATSFVPSQKVDAVMTNPPFGTIKVANYNGSKITKLEHLIALKALESMKDDGRAAIIVGANMNSKPVGQGNQWIFENYLAGHYNVVSTFEVSGDLYKKQGAQWPVRVIVIDGKKENGAAIKTDDTAIAPRFETWEDVLTKAEEVRNEIGDASEVLDAGRQSLLPESGAEQQQNRKAGDEGSIPARSGGVAADVGVRSQSGRNQSSELSDRGRSARDGVAIPSERTAQQSANAAVANLDVSGRAGNQTGRLEGRDNGRADSPGSRPGGTERGSERPVTRKLPRPPAVEGTDLQVAYQPRSGGQPFETLIPRNLAPGVFGFLDKMTKEVGALESYLSEKTGLPIDTVLENMAGEQIDGAAMAIYQMEHDGAMVIADETGIGKGRQAAAIIQYAKTSGKIPIFFTKDPKLFTDMYGDVADIGGSVNPFLFGSATEASIVDKNGKVLVRAPSAQKQKAEIARIMEVGFSESGYDAAFLSYSQIRQENHRQAFIEALAENENVVIIMDEAHEASGDAGTSMQAAFFTGGEVKKGSGANKVTAVKRGILNAAGTKSGRGGVVYLSATFAKRPDNMPLYFRTSIQKAAQNFPDIVTAMESGGVAMQQVVSEALAKEGQLIRRERDFTGIPYETVRVKTANDVAMVEQVDNVTDVLTQVVSFSKQIKEAMSASMEGKGTALTDTQINSTDFAATVHNQISQLLLAAKADVVVENAIKAHQAGEKPVIALTSTMESFLSQYVDGAGLKQGSEITLRWNELLKFALSRTLRMSVKDAGGTSEVITVTPQQFGLEGLYREVEAAADAIDIRLPVSPIDYIIQKLNASGVRAIELTGRTSGIKYADFESGAGTYETFKKANKNQVVSAFNEGRSDAVLLNASGSTGLSIHASEKFSDSRPRHMLIAQPSLDINVFIQTLGRIKRTGMVSGGAKYTHLVLPLQAEIRPAAITSKKMKSLNANTTADSESAVSIKAEDIMNKYGDRVVAEYLEARPDLQDALDIEVLASPDGDIKAKEGIARQFTGRMALRPDFEQSQAYADIIPAYKELVEQLKSTGEYDLEVAVHDDWDGKFVGESMLSAGTDESNIFTASTKVQQWEIKDTRHAPTTEEMRAEFQKSHKSSEDLSAEIDRGFAAATDVFKEKAQKARDRVDAASGDTERRVAENALASIKKAYERMMSSKEIVERATYHAGEFVELTSPDGDSMTGMLASVKMPPAASGRVAPSAYRFTFLTNRPGGRIHLTGASFANNQWEISRSYDSAETIDHRPEGGRYVRTFIVGNPIAAYTATEGAGKMVQFKADDGSVVTGLQMPMNWSEAKLAKDPRRDFASAEAVVHYMSSHSGTVEMQDVTVGRASWSPNINITVPASKSRGGKVFLDERLTSLIGDFQKQGNKMIGRVRSDELSGAISRIMEITGQRFRASKNTAIEDVAASNDAVNPGSKRARAGASGADAMAEGSSPSIDNFKPDTEKHADPEIKLYEESKALIKKYGGNRKIMEGRQPFGAMGVSYRNTGNIALASLNNIGVAAHETAHNVDRRIRFSERITRTVGVTADGNPKYAPGTLPERAALTKVYTEFYPNGKKSHKLEKRMVEGYATFIQKFIEDPNGMRDKFPELTGMIVTEGGKYYDPMVADLIKDARKIVNAYHKLDPLRKIGTRISVERRMSGDKFLNTKDRVEAFMADRIWPIEKLAKEAGVQLTDNDPSVALREFERIGRVFSHNVNKTVGGRETYLSLRDGEYKAVHDFNYHTIARELSKNGMEDSFNRYLVARESVSRYEYVDDLKIARDEAKAALEDARQVMAEMLADGEDSVGFMVGDKSIKDLTAEYKAAHRKWIEQKNVLKNDNLDRTLVEDAVALAKDTIPNLGKIEEMFDALVRADLDLLHEVGLISAKDYKALGDRKGYVTKKREIFNDLIDPETGVVSSASNLSGKSVSSMKRRKGSELTIIDPMFATISNHNEILRKAMRQHIYNKIGALADKVPDLMQKEALKRVYDKETGKTAYPQDSDPNVIMARTKDGTRVPYVINKDVKKYLDAALTSESVDITEKILAGASRLFTKGTTGLYPAFMFSNIVVDQVTATAQTRTEYLPVVSQMKMLWQAMRGDASKEAAFMREYMTLAGATQTLTGWNQLSPQKAREIVAGESSALQKIGKIYQAGETILGAPSQGSEIFTRITEYVGSRMGGDSQFVALEKAGRVTAPFHHRGSWGGKTAGRATVRGIPYLNAGIQVIKEYSKSFADERAGRAALVTALVVGAKVAELIPMMLLASDDQKEKYKDLEPDELARYIIVPARNGVDLLRFRMPEQMTGLGVGINMALQEHLGSNDYSFDEYKSGMTAWIPDQFDVTEPTRMALSWIPQLARPSIEVSMNVRTWPRPRPMEGQSVQYLPPSERAYRTTSDAAKAIGKVIGNQTGLSPIKADALLEGYLGRSVKLFTKTEGEVGKLLDPYTRSAYFEAGRRVQSFYDKSELITQTKTAAAQKKITLTKEEQRFINRQDAIIKDVKEGLKKYRDLEDDRSTKAAVLHAKIIDGIDALDSDERYRRQFSTVSSGYDPFNPKPPKPPAPPKPPRWY